MPPLNIEDSAFLRYTTFNKVYKERWSDILRFRARSLFTSCEVCCAFKAQLQDRSLTFEQKLGCLQGYRSHLHDQYCDRTVIWTLQSEGSDPRSSILLICTDGLDQAKFSLPRDPQLRSNAGLTFSFTRKFIVCHPCYVDFSLLSTSAYHVLCFLPSISGPNTSGHD